MNIFAFQTKCAFYLKLEWYVFKKRNEDRRDVLGDREGVGRDGV